MMVIEEHYNLQKLNTFGVSVRARYFSRFSSIETLHALVTDVRFSHLNILCLGAGSNVLFTTDFAGLVLHNEIPGIQILSQTDQVVRLWVGAGTNWSEFVQYCLQQGWSGLENLSLIPGTVGAAPIQNIGAYGVEVKELIARVHVYNLATQQVEVLTSEDCQFGYRDSVFKGVGKNRWIITAVEFVLSKQPALKTHYGAIETELQQMGIQSPSPKDVAAAVIRIRQAKLPDPKRLGNAGSFFKNPKVPSAQYEKLKKMYPTLVGFLEESGEYKLAAGWLVEHCGLKGHREGHCGVHEHQALVLVNYGGATGREIMNLADRVKTAVLQKFQVELETEVNIL